MKQRIPIAAWLIFGLFWIMGLISFIFLDKGQFLIDLNHWHTPVLDQVFKYATFMGDGMIYAVLGIIVLLFGTYYRFIVLAAVALIQTIPVQLGKRLFFSGFDRPRNYFGARFEELHTVAGVHIHGSHSFPSGHTASAFAVATFLIWYSKDKRWGALWALLAVLVAFSRMYLLQHFLMDTFAGSIIGVGSSLLVCWWMDHKTKLHTRSGLNRGILKA